MSDANRKTAALALAVAIAAPMEGLRQWAYRDPPGIPTICMGHTAGVRMGDFRTVPECKALLTGDMTAAINAVEVCVPGLAPNVLAAFGDAAFNLGPKIACDLRRSTAARKLKAGDIIGACHELLKWNKSTVAGVPVALPGLTKRRLMERDLCLSSYGT